MYVEPALDPLHRNASTFQPTDPELNPILAKLFEDPRLACLSLSSTIQPALEMGYVIETTQLSANDRELILRKSNQGHNRNEF